MADGYSQYAEALAVLSSIDQRRRDALRKAVESAAAEENEVKSRIADQQRMYVRTGRDIDDVQKALAEISALFGGQPASSPTLRPQETAEVLPLATIRSTVAEITSWTAETRPLLDSLLRSRDRVAQAPRPPDPQLVASPAPPAPKSRPAWGVWLWGGLAVVAVVVTVGVFAINQ